MRNREAGNGTWTRGPQLGKLMLYHWAIPAKNLSRIILIYWLNCQGNYNNIAYNEITFRVYFAKFGLDFSLSRGVPSSRLLLVCFCIRTNSPIPAINKAKIDTASSLNLPGFLKIRHADIIDTTIENSSTQVLTSEPVAIKPANEKPPTQRMLETQPSQS